MRGTRRGSRRLDARFLEVVDGVVVDLPSLLLPDLDL